MFLAALLTIVERYKETNYSSMKEQNVVYIYTTEYYSAFKKEILTHAKTWMNPDDIMLSGISQSQKDKYGDSIYIGKMEQSYFLMGSFSFAR